MLLSAVLLVVMGHATSATEVSWSLAFNHASIVDGCFRYVYNAYKNRGIAQRRLLQMLMLPAVSLSKHLVKPFNHGRTGHALQLIATS
jgi:hypothetical protein